MFLLKKLITFDSVDGALDLTKQIRPKILTSISEQIEAGFSRIITLDSKSTPEASLDNVLIFHATEHDQVFLMIAVQPRKGDFQPVQMQVDGCPILLRNPRDAHIDNHEITDEMKHCEHSDVPGIHSLRIFPRAQPLRENTILDVSVVVVVLERVHDHVEDHK